MISIHPSVDKGIKAGVKDFAVAPWCVMQPRMRCEVTVTSNSRTTTPAAAPSAGSQKGALSRSLPWCRANKVSVTKKRETNSRCDPSATIQRHACTGCRVHSTRASKKISAFHGLDFNPYRSCRRRGLSAPGFAGFVSSIIESGFDPNRMAKVRGRLKELGLETYDVSVRP